MERILEKRYVLEYIRDTLNDLKQGRTGVDNARYNHNSDYSSASNIIRFGILSFLEQNRLGLRNDSPEFLQTMNDEESHINGINGISLSVVGLTDLYPNEDEYDPRRPHSVNFLVSSDIKTDRKAYHFGNEFIAILKETALLGMASIMELTFASQQIIALTRDYLFNLVCIGIVYLLIVMVITFLLRLLERRLSRSER